LRLWNPEGERVITLRSFIPFENLAVASLEENVTEDMGADRTHLTPQARGLTTIIVTPAASDPVASCKSD